MTLTNVTENCILDDAEVLDPPLHATAISPNGQIKIKPKILLDNILKISQNIDKLALPGKTVSIHVISSSAIINHEIFW